MKKSKIMVSILIIIIIFIIFGAFYFSYKASKKDKNKNITTTLTQNTTKVSPKEINGIINSKIPDNFEGYSFEYFNFDNVYNYFYTLKDDETKGKQINELDKYVKVENGKLMWNINNEWVTDSKINGNIKYCYSNHDYNDPTYWIITDDTIYIINYTIFESDKTTLTFDEYNNGSFKYSSIALPGKIQKISEKMNCEAECWNYLLIEINNKIKLVYDGQNENNNQRYKLEEFDLSSFEYISLYVNMVRIQITLNGIVKNALDISGQPIKVKEFIPVEKNNGVNNDADNYQLIIDQNDYLYSIHNGDFDSVNKYNYIGKVKSFQTNYDINHNIFQHVSYVNIKLEDGKEITLRQVVD